MNADTIRAALTKEAHGLVEAGAAMNREADDPEGQAAARFTELAGTGLEQFAVGATDSQLLRIREIILSA